MAERDELDRLLDAGLASYSDREPLAGIEERVLRRMTGAKKRRWLWWLGAAVPVAAAVLVLVTNRETIAPVPVKPVAEVRPAPVFHAPVVPGRSTHIKRRARATQGDRFRHAKQSEFPTAAPMTAQERGLLELAAMAPEALLMEPAGAIEIQPILIKPLEMNGTN